MLPDRVSNPGPLTYESGALPIALRGPACHQGICKMKLTYSFFSEPVEYISSEETQESTTDMATGLPLPLYTLPTSAMDLRYKSPYLNDAAIVPYVTSGSPFPTCAMNVNSVTLSQWNYYNSLVASAASQNFMATMLRMSSNSTRLSPQSRDSGISSDPAVSPQGSLDLSLTPNRNKGINQK